MPANQGGTNFAQGGARVTGLPGVPDSPPTGTATPIATQVAQLVSGAPLDSGALYAVWGGANDIFFQLGALGAGAITPAATAGERRRGRRRPGAASRRSCEAAGARNIVVFNLPDIGRSPLGRRAPGRARKSARSPAFSTTR